MKSSDDTGNVISGHFTGNDNQENETGQCFICMKSVMLEVRVPREKRKNSWRKKLIPYNLIRNCEQTAEGIFIETHDDTRITIEGDRLDRIFDAIGNHRLRMIKPLGTTESKEKDQPWITKIIIRESE